MSRIEIPLELNRNSPKVLALGIENTGSTILSYGNELLGYVDLAGKDVLDVGCGARFTQTIINHALPIQSYTGIDIDEPLIGFLREHVTDDRFSFYYWHTYNQRYNPNGRKLTKRSRLPLPQDRRFDLIWMYSVITHNDPGDTECLLYILRRYIKEDAALLFSAFTDNSIATFEDRIKDQPLLNAYYNETFLRRLASRAGWQLEPAPNRRQGSVIQNLFICRPKPHFWEFFGKG
jgi:SAM-dependent methyltransferase